jgi:hypothetical protein
MTKGPTMIRMLLVFTLAAVATGASAADWPWQDTPEERPDYCKGFVVGGLASSQVAGPLRTDLWLAWNYLIRSTALSNSTATQEYQSGRELFTPQMDVALAQANVAEADGSCGLGRKGHQVTGW